MESRHPAEGYFGNEFPSFYNGCGVMAAWSRKTWKNCDFLRFSENDPLQENFHNSVQKGFTASPINVFCSKFVKFGRRERTLKSCVAYLSNKKKKISPGSPALTTTRIALKVCQGQPRTMFSKCSRFHLKRFTFDGVTPEWVNTRKTRCKVFLIFGRNLSSSRILHSFNGLFLG